MAASPALAPRQLLAAWDSGQSQDALGRSLALLSLAHPDCSREELAQIPLGRRDAALLDVRERLLGGRVACWLECPACAVKLEFEVEAGALKTRPPHPPADGPLAIEHAGFRVVFRLPETRDIAYAGRARSIEEALEILLSRCVVSAECEGTSVEAAALPPNVVAVLSDAMEASDPQAELMTTETCPDCGHEWASVLDVPAFLWKEVCGVVQRLLYEVATLARAYGWSEDEILALSPHRRQAYLELAGA